METILSARGVTFKGILNYPDIDVPAGAITFISGDSGSGKSTLLRLFNGMYSPTSGTLFFKGEDITGINSIQLRRDVLLAGQTTYLFEGDIAGNFNQFYSYRGLPVPDTKTVEKFLQICNIPFAPTANCAQMSGGERQRIYLSIFLSFMPQVLLLDEPTSALDIENAQTILANIFDFCSKNGITPVVVSHNLSLVEKYAQNILYLKGRGE